jgi:hypothetical protein
MSHLIRNAAGGSLEAALAMASGLVQPLRNCGWGAEDYGDLAGTAERVARGIQDEYTYQPPKEDF